MTAKDTTMMVSVDLSYGEKKAVYNEINSKCNPTAEDRDDFRAQWYS
jgi:hypothetical protein